MISFLCKLCRSVHLKNSLTTDPPLFLPPLILSSSIEILDKSSRALLLWCVLTAVIPTDVVQSNRGHDSVRVRKLVCQGRVVSRIVVAANISSRGPLGGVVDEGLVDFADVDGIA